MSQAEFKRRLKALMLRPENQVCSDCPERQPRWASLIKPPPGAPHGTQSMGAFCCLECSGSHRRLGVHISFVRSINLDSWTEKEVLAMENGGNAKVNAIFEARLSVAKPTNSASGPVRERFIRDKYERRKFYDPSAFDRVSQMEAAQEREEVVSGVQRRLNSSRKPSDAARKRVEERAARNRAAGGGGGGAAVRNPRAVKAPAPVAAPAPAPVADLLDFGDFSSAEATSAVQASASFSGGGAAAPASNGGAPADAPVPNQEPQMDLFANMNGGQAQQELQQTTATPPEQKKMTNSDIMSMFNTPAQNNPMQQNMFAMGNQGGMQNGMGGMGGMNANNMGMMNQMNQMGQQQMNSQMMGQQQMNPQQMGMMNNNMQMMQMQNMMGQQQGMANNMGNGNMMGGMGNMGMMGGQQGMGNMGGNNMNMMQQPQMNNMMMQGGGGGGMMMQGGGNQFGQAMGGQAQSTSQKQRGGGQIDQFASFGNFGR